MVSFASPPQKKKNLKFQQGVYISHCHHLLAHVSWGQMWGGAGVWGCGCKIFQRASSEFLKNIIVRCWGARCRCKILNIYLENRLYRMLGCGDVGWKGVEYLENFREYFLHPTPHAPLCSPQYLHLTIVGLLCVGAIRHPFPEEKFVGNLKSCSGNAPESNEILHKPKCTL